MKAKFPVVCPSCAEHLHVTTLACAQCNTAVTGHFEVPLISQLNVNDQAFILQFVKCSGSLKMMAEKMHLSYPTVRNILDDLIEKLNDLESKA